METQGEETRKRIRQIAELGCLPYIPNDLFLIGHLRVTTEHVEASTEELSLEWQKEEEEWTQ